MNILLFKRSIWHWKRTYASLLPTTCFPLKHCYATRNIFVQLTLTYCSTTHRMHYYVSTATMVTWTRHIVTKYVHCLSFCNPALELVKMWGTKLWFYWYLVRVAVEHEWHSMNDVLHNDVKQTWGFEITHNDTPQSVGLLWTRDRPVAKIFTWQHTPLTRYIRVPGGIQTRNPSKWSATHPRLRPLGHWDRLTQIPYSARRLTVNQIIPSLCAWGTIWGRKQWVLSGDVTRLG
jgi:hypothetical protein